MGKCHKYIDNKSSFCKTYHQWPNIQYSNIPYHLKKINAKKISLIYEITLM